MLKACQEEITTLFNSSLIARRATAVAVAVVVAVVVTGVAQALPLAVFDVSVAGVALEYLRTRGDERSAMIRYLPTAASGSARATPATAKPCTPAMISGMSTHLRAQFRDAILFAASEKFCVR